LIGVLGQPVVLVRPTILLFLLNPFLLPSLLRWFHGSLPVEPMVSLYLPLALLLFLCP
jgi:hypothetical protein